MRREATTAVALLAGGAGLMFVAAALEPEPAGAAALALVSGAGAAASLAARGWVRRLVGLLLAVAGVVSGVVAVTTGSWAAAAGGVCTLAGGAWVAWRGPRWSRLSDRYERTSTNPDTPHALWDALDRGEDPTR